MRCKEHKRILRHEKSYEFDYHFFIIQRNSRATKIKSKRFFNMWSNHESVQMHRNIKLMLAKMWKAREKRSQNNEQRNHKYNTKLHLALHPQHAFMNSSIFGWALVVAAAPSLHFLHSVSVHTMFSMWAKKREILVHWQFIVSMHFHRFRRNVVASHFFCLNLRTNRKSYFSCLYFCTWFISLFLLLFSSIIYIYCLDGVYAETSKLKTQKPNGGVLRLPLLLLVLLEGIKEASKKSASTKINRLFPLVVSLWQTFLFYGQQWAAPQTS